MKKIALSILEKLMKQFQVAPIRLSTLAPLGYIYRFLKESNHDSLKVFGSGA